MADPKEPFNERGHAEKGRVSEKAERVRDMMAEHQERRHPDRLARRIEALHKQERPAPTLDMTPRDRAAELKQRAERDVAGREAGERAKLERARGNEMRKAADGQTQSAEKAQAEARAKAARERMERASAERTSRSHARNLKNERD